MIYISNSGKQFENSFEQSSKEQGLFTFRVKDINYMAIKRGYRISRNPYDTIIFDGETLFTLELKSTKSKSISFSGSNPHIKEHQIEALTQSSQHDGVISGFILNFREPTDQTYFIHIDEMLHYMRLAQSQSEHPYKCRKGRKLNRASISLDICQEIGIEVLSIKKQVNYRYFVKNLTGELAARWNHETQNKK